MLSFVVLSPLFRAVFFCIFSLLGYMLVGLFAKSWMHQLEFCSLLFLCLNQFAAT